MSPKSGGTDETSPGRTGGGGGGSRTCTSASPTCAPLRGRHAPGRAGARAGRRGACLVDDDCLGGRGPLGRRRLPLARAQHRHRLALRNLRRWATREMRMAPMAPKTEGPRADGWTRPEARCACAKPGVSALHETCPLSTGGKTRRVQLVGEGRRGGAARLTRGALPSRACRVRAQGRHHLVLQPQSAPRRRDQRLAVMNHLGRN